MENEPRPVPTPEINAPNQHPVNAYDDVRDLIKVGRGEFPTFHRPDGSGKFMSRHELDSVQSNQELIRGEELQPKLSDPQEPPPQEIPASELQHPYEEPAPEHHKPDPNQDESDIALTGLKKVCWEVSSRLPLTSGRKSRIKTWLELEEVKDVREHRMHNYGLQRIHGEDIGRPQFEARIAQEDRGFRDKRRALADHEHFKKNEEHAHHVEGSNEAVTPENGQQELLHTKHKIEQSIPLLQDEARQGLSEIDSTRQELEDKQKELAILMATEADHEKVEEVVPFGEFPVNVRRSSGKIESGWYVVRYKESPSGEQMAFVRKPPGRSGGKVAEKWVKAADLKAWQA